MSQLDAQDIFLLLTLNAVGALVPGLILGVSAGWRNGLGSFIGYRVTLQALIRLRLMPAHPVAFLDFAAEHVLLQRVGGGYRFIHGLLLDYFADQWPALSAHPPARKG